MNLQGIWLEARDLSLALRVGVWACLAHLGLGRLGNNSILLHCCNNTLLQFLNANTITILLA